MGGCSFLNCCAVITVHNAHFKVCTAKVKVDLCNITSEGVTQIWFTKMQQGTRNICMVTCQVSAMR